MPNVGPLELAIVLVVALVVFGPKKLPELGRSLGSGMKEFKDSISARGESPQPARALVADFSGRGASSAGASEAEPAAATPADESEPSEADPGIR